MLCYIGTQWHMQTMLCWCFQYHVLRYIYIPYTYTSGKRPTACCGSTCSLLSRNILRTPESHPRALQFRLSVKMMRHTHPTDTDTSVDGGFKHGFLCPCLSRNGVYPRQDANCDRELGQIPHYWIWQNTVYQLELLLNQYWTHIESILNPYYWMI